MMWGIGEEIDGVEGDVVEKVMYFFFLLVCACVCVCVCVWMREVECVSINQCAIRISNNILIYIII